jgi:hypothetical protein
MSLQVKVAKFQNQSYGTTTRNALGWTENVAGSSPTFSPSN